jgi:hypothetical protein
LSTRGFCSAVNGRVAGYRPVDQRGPRAVNFLGRPVYFVQDALKIRTSFAEPPVLQLMLD